MVFSPVSLPKPSTTVTFLDFMSPCRPLYLPATMLSLYSRTLAMSTETSPMLTPYFSEFWASVASSAECRYALVGMQPQCRQVPPSLDFSISATLKPSWTPRRAAA